MAEIRGALRQVPVGELQPNDWNPNRMDDQIYQKELNSIRRFGFVSPIIVRGIEIIDGEHRWRAAMELGMVEVPVWDVGDLSDGDAKQLTLTLNRLRGEDDPVRLRDLLRDLATFQPLPELLAVLPWNKTQFSRLAELPEVDWNELEEQRGRSSAGQKWVERIYRMPVEVAEVLDNALSKAKKDARREGIDDRLDDVGALELIAADYLAS